MTKKWQIGEVVTTKNSWTIEASSPKEATKLLAQHLSGKKVKVPVRLISCEELESSVLTTPVETPADATPEPWNPTAVAGKGAKK